MTVRDGGERGSSDIQCSTGHGRKNSRAADHGGDFHAQSCVAKKAHILRVVDLGIGFIGRRSDAQRLRRRLGVCRLRSQAVCGGEAGHREQRESRSQHDVRVSYLVKRRSPIDDERLPGDEVAIGRGEKCDRSDEICRLLHTGQGPACHGRAAKCQCFVAALLFAQGASRCDAVYGNVVRAEFGC